MQRGLVITSGVFDLFHVGHLRFLQSASLLGRWLFVALNDDESVQELKGPTRPIIPYADRCELIGSVPCVDAIIEYDGDIADLLEYWQPEIFVKGSDWRGKKIFEEKLVQQYGGRVEYVDSSGPHTSDIIQQIKKGDS